MLFLEDERLALGDLSAEHNLHRVRIVAMGADNVIDRDIFRDQLGFSEPDLNPGALGDHVITRRSFESDQEDDRIVGRCHLATESESDHSFCMTQNTPNTARTYLREGAEFDVWFPLARRAYGESANTTAKYEIAFLVLGFRYYGIPDVNVRQRIADDNARQRTAFSHYADTHYDQLLDELIDDDVVVRTRD